MADALSRKHATLNAMIEWKQLEFLASFDLQPSPSYSNGFLEDMIIRPTLRERVQSAQDIDEELRRIKEKVVKREIFPHSVRYSISNDRSLL